MSIISHKHKFVFVHIPKSAGVSISLALQHYASYGRVYKGTKHHTLTELRGMLPEIREYYSFAFVRNSWDRIVSLYHWMHERKEQTRVTEPFDEFVRSLATRKDTCRYTANLQLNYIRNTRRDADFVGKFENLEEDFRKVVDHLGLEARLEKSNGSRHEPYRNYYTDETKEIIYKMFKEDIEHFKYEF